jgi:hypothetical protein
LRKFRGYVYEVPFAEDVENIFLKTIYKINIPTIKKILIDVEGLTIGEFAKKWNLDEEEREMDESSVRGALFSLATPEEIERIKVKPIHEGMPYRYLRCFFLRFLCSSSTSAGVR